MSLKDVKDLGSRYYAKTPAFWVKVGDGLLIISTSVTAYSIGADQDLVAYVALFSGVAGKVILNFAKE